MSWGIDVTGSRDGVKAKVSAQLDKVAETYAGKPEGEDVLAIKARILALVDACELGADAYGTDWNAVVVKANGSHSWTDRGITSASFQCSVTRAALAL